VDISKKGFGGKKRTTQLAKSITWKEDLEERFLYTSKRPILAWEKGEIGGVGRLQWNARGGAIGDKQKAGEVHKNLAMKSTRGSSGLFWEQLIGEKKPYGRSVNDYNPRIIDQGGYGRGAQKE